MSLPLITLDKFPLGTEAENNKLWRMFSELGMFSPKTNVKVVEIWRKHSEPKGPQQPGGVAGQTHLSGFKKV